MNIEESYSLLESKVQHLTTTIKELKEREAHLHEELKEAELLYEVAKTISNKMKDDFTGYMNRVISEAIDLLFPGYAFSLTFVERRNRTEADIRIVSPEGIVLDPFTALGGGLVDITTFALRIICWSLSQKAPLFVLDEPFRFISRDLQPLAKDLLRTIATDWNVQLVMVTHEEGFINVATNYHLSMKDGVTVVDFSSHS
jgi:DNA repair exonuclease SbcCD ATPase subunit